MTPELYGQVRCKMFQSMTENKLKIYTHTFLLFALVTGYPMTVIFIIFMIPYLLYMVFKMNVFIYPL